MLSKGTWPMWLQESVRTVGRVFRKTSPSRPYVVRTTEYARWPSLPPGAVQVGPVTSVQLLDASTGRRFGSVLSLGSSEPEAAPRSSLTVLPATRAVEGAVRATLSFLRPVKAKMMNAFEVRDTRALKNILQRKGREVQIEEE